MGFDVDWLALRAPADARARDRGLLAEARALAGRSRPPLVVDLGCGAGASIRALDLAEANWRLVDNDDALLARAVEVAAEKGQRAETMALDLAHGVAEALQGADLVVSSAFLDLVSEDWIDGFVAALPAQAGVYVALSYSGEMRWSPSHALDEAVLAAFNRHQSGDKGFGPALGPKAAMVLAERLREAGRAPVLARSDWRLTRAADGQLMDELNAGIAKAAEEMALDVQAWRATRPKLQEALVSHLDLFAAPLTADVAARPGA